MILVVALLQLDRQEALVPLQLGDLALRVAVLALQNLQLLLKFVGKPIEIASTSNPHSKTNMHALFFLFYADFFCCWQSALNAKVATIPRSARATHTCAFICDFRNGLAANL